MRLLPTQPNPATAAFTLPEVVEVGSIELLLVIVLDMLVVELTDEVLVMLLVELVEFIDDEVEEPVWTELRVNVMSVPSVAAASVVLEEEEEMEMYRSKCW